MLNLSYTKSIKIQTLICEIDQVRKDLLLLPLSLSSMWDAQFRSLVEQISYGLNIQGDALGAKVIVHMLSPDIKYSQKIPIPWNVTRYRKALNYIYTEWTGCTEMITAQNISSLFAIIQDHDQTLQEFEKGLQYVQANTEHPIIQAALIYIFSLEFFTHAKNGEIFSIMLSNIILYKYGYDIKRLLNIEKQIVTNRTSYLQIIKNSKTQETITEWIEFFCSIILDSYKNIELILSKHTSTKTTKLFQLSPRQKIIISFLDNPHVRITNRFIQDYFHISQITASRELSELASLGLLLSIGKGRSTYYTKM